MQLWKTQDRDKPHKNLHYVPNCVFQKISISFISSVKGAYINWPPLSPYYCIWSKI